MVAKGWAILVGVLAIVTVGAGWVWAEAAPVEVAVRKAVGQISEDTSDKEREAILLPLKAYAVPDIQNALDAIYATAGDVPTKLKVLELLFCYYRDPGHDQQRLEDSLRKAILDEDQRVAKRGVHLAAAGMDFSNRKAIYRQRLETVDDQELLYLMLSVFSSKDVGDILMRELQRPIPDVADKVARERWLNRLFMISQREVRRQTAPPGLKEKLVDLIAAEPSLVVFAVPRLLELGAGDVVPRLRALHDKAASERVEMALAAAIACLDPSPEEKEKFQGRFVSAIGDYQTTGKGWQSVLRLNEMVCLLAVASQSEAPLVRLCELGKKLPIARRAELLGSMIKEEMFPAPHLAATALDTLSDEELKQIADNAPVLRDQLRFFLDTLNATAIYVPRDKSAQAKLARERLERLFGAEGAATKVK